MPTSESTYHLMVKPTAKNLTALASMDLRQPSLKSSSA